MFFPICHPERSEESREHKVSATEIFRRFAPLNDIMIEISILPLVRRSCRSYILAIPQLPERQSTMFLGKGKEYPVGSSK